MEEIRCRKCSRPLRDPESIARGMGPECAGITGGGRKVHYAYRGPVYTRGGGESSPTLFTLAREDEELDEEIIVVQEAVPVRGLPDILRQFPADLVDLVLSAPGAGTITDRIKVYSGRHNRQPNAIRPAKTLQEIRRMCIEMRLSFWPGISCDGQPIACFPYGEYDWQFEKSERILSRAELEAYLLRYEMIGPVR
ncbi:MAG: DUF6011 domain-containing protein [Bacteroidota bacterium]